MGGVVRWFVKQEQVKLGILAMVCLPLFFAAGQTCIADETQKEETAKSKASVEEKAVVQGTKPPPGGTITETEAQAVDRSGKERLDDAITCLARAIHWEAKNSGVVDMEAVAFVVMNRLGHEGFPSTVCGIIKEGEGKRACQFSWWCRRRSHSAHEEKSYVIAKEIARKALNRELKDRTGGALYFHRKRSIPPQWAKEYVRTATIDNMVFYKPAGGKAK